MWSICDRTLASPLTYLLSLKQADVCAAAMQDVSLQTTCLSSLNLLKCAELRALTYPELDTALAQQPAGGSRAKVSA